MAIRRVLCGSSVYVQKKSSCSLAAWGFCCFSALTVKLAFGAFPFGTVAVETEDRIVTVVEKQLRAKREDGGVELWTFVELTLSLSSALVGRRWVDLAPWLADLHISLATPLAQEHVKAF
jgi:hypothetical protein